VEADKLFLASDFRKLAGDEDYETMFLFGGGTKADIVKILLQLNINSNMTESKFLENDVKVTIFCYIENQAIVYTLFDGEFMETIENDSRKRMAFGILYELHINSETHYNDGYVNTLRIVQFFSHQLKYTTCKGRCVAFEKETCGFQWRSWSLNWCVVIVKYDEGASCAWLLGRIRNKFLSVGSQWQSLWEK